MMHDVILGFHSVLCRPRTVQAPWCTCRISRGRALGAGFKERAAVAAKQAYESTAAATAQVKQKAAARDWSKESQVLGRAQQSALG